MILLDGKKLSGEIAERLKGKIEGSGVVPTLAIVQIGAIEESNIYIKHKKNFADKIGAKVSHIVLPIDIKEEEVVSKIKELNEDATTNGIILQLPIPENLNKRKLIETINPSKDVDGLHSVNQSKIFQGDDSGIIPATPKGVMSLLREYKIALEGKRVLVIGRSLLVGRPMAMLLLKDNATVTIAHSKTQKLKDLINESDIVVVAVGRAGLITKDMVKEGQVIVDVGTNSVAGPKTLEEVEIRKLVGDVDFEEVSKIVHALSPVPGGVGPMTVASLFQNLVDISFELK
jgi:methylenetetrahydrofolate dehydrogenase (NADP+) / methenyltetrahydrofolate cyclohydrolase